MLRGVFADAAHLEPPWRAAEHDFGGVDEEDALMHVNDSAPEPISTAGTA
jgi:hypothetical protein